MFIQVKCLFCIFEYWNLIPQGKMLSGTHPFSVFLILKSKVKCLWHVASTLAMFFMPFVNPGLF